MSWYETLRAGLPSARLRVLLIAESPLDPGARVRRFFYSPELTVDNLYRGVAQALYGERGDVDLSDKPAVLERIRADGLWLIDAVDQPVNKLTDSARARPIRAGVPGLVRRCRELAPELGVIVCHGKVYAASAPALRAAGVRVLHDAVPARQLAGALRAGVSPRTGVDAVRATARATAGGLER